MMRELLLSELMDLYLDTLSRCGTYLLFEDDEVVGYNIFEEFDIGVISFLYPINVEKLLHAGYISKDKADKSILLYNKVIEIQSSEEWTISALRTSAKWKYILELADEINMLE